MKKYGFLFITLSVVFIGFFHEITAINQDLGRHILLGKIIVQTRVIPNTNLLSYTYPDYQFINHHWLSEVVFYGFSQLVGLSGLLLFTSFVATGAFALVAFTSMKKFGIVPTLFVSAFYLPILFERTDLRPEIFSFLFVTLFVTILFQNKEQPTRWLYVLIPLLLLWVNMHIYFLIGVLLIGLFLIDEGIAYIQKKSPNKRFFPLLITFCVSLFATLCNPYGLTGALYPFIVLQQYGYAIEENQHILFLWQLNQKSSIAYFLLASILVVLSLLLTRKRTRRIDWLLVVTCIGVASIAIRNFPLFVLITFLPFARTIKIFSERIALHTPLLTGIQKAMPFFLVFILLFHGYNETRMTPIGATLTPGAQKGVDFLITNTIQGPLFNNFDIGSYLAYRLYPKEKVFVDGRPEAYPPAFFKDIYIPMQNSPILFKKQDEQYHFNTIFFSHSDQTPWAQIFLRSILHNPEWKPVYLDDFVIILIKNTQANASLIRTSGMDTKTLLPSYYNKHDLQSLLRLVYFFHLTQLPKQEIVYLKKIITLQPNHCSALGILGNLLQKDSPQETEAIFKQYQAYCQ